MASPDPAAARFWMLQLLRLTGVVLAALGAMILAGRLAWPVELGVLMLTGGAVGFFFLPPMLARKWKSPD